MNRCLPTFLLGVVVAFAAAAPAAAAQRWASPSADANNTTCLSSSPCTLQTAVNGAATAGSNEVVVTAGTYDLAAPLSVGSGLWVHGEDGAERPVLRGATGMSVTMVSVDGGRLSHLELLARGASQHALKLKEGAVGERLIVRSERGDGGKLTAAAGGTRLVNSVVDIRTAGVEAIELLGSAGSVTLRNVTVYAPESTTTAVLCGGSATLSVVNSIVRGGLADVNASKYACAVDHSAIRPELSPGVTPTNNVATDPTLDSLFRPLGGSSSIDAGIDDPANGPSDLGGASRSQGARTDIGAYEYASGSGDPVDPAPPLPPVEDPAPPVVPPADETQTGSGSGSGGGGGGSGSTPGSATRPDDGNGASPLQIPPGRDGTPGAPTHTPAPVLPPAAPPQLGKSVVLDDAGKGDVKVRLPGTRTFVRLTDPSRLPVGTVIDTRRGTVTLQSALPGAQRQTGTFSGGMFTVRQNAKARGMVDIHLTGGSFRGCRPKASRARGAVAHAAARRKPVRRLWSSDRGGKFRTHGKDSVATVRGTRWLTEDRCDGTYTKVVEGAVDVKDKTSGKVRRVRAGQSILVR